MEMELCMKCGRELKPGQVFCDGCLADMEKHPVKPGVVVLLPDHKAAAQRAAARRRYPTVSPEEQISRLRARVKRLWIALALVSALAAGAGWLVVNDWLTQDDGSLLPGQNYSSEKSQETSETP